MASPSKRNGVGDDTSSNRKRRNPNDPGFIDDYSESRSSDNHWIYLTTATGEFIPVTVKASDTIDEMKLKIQQAKAHTRANMPIKESACESVGFMDIFIKNLEGRITYSLEVKPSDTIGYVRAKSHGHLLMFNGVVLEDSGTLDDLHIVNGSTLTGINKAKGKMEIFVKNTITRRTHSLLVTPKNTIADVKLKIGYKEKDESNKELFEKYKEKLEIYEEKLKTIYYEYIPFDEQVLIFNGMALEDSGTLLDFHIKGKSTLTLMRSSRRLMRIFIKTFRERVITVEVNPSYTIGNVKSKIQDKIDIPHDEQELIFNELVLDNFDTIADSGINEESTLTLVRKSTGCMHIFINMEGGKIINMKVKPSDTVYNVISKIAASQGIPRCQLTLGFDRMGLNDNLTLADYHIHEKSTIHSRLHVIGG